MERDSMMRTTTILSKEGGRYSKRKEEDTQKGRRKLLRKKGGSYSKGKDNIS